MSWTRRAWLQGSAAALGACTGEPPAAWHGGWLGAQVERGHRLRGAESAWASAVLRKAQVLVVGAGVAGLAAARTLAQRGIDEVHLLELEDQAGGNSRGHVLGGMACPLGAHYLPLPGPQAREVQALLYDLGLAHHELGRTVYDERHLCHSPQERLYFDGAWHEGLLPPAEAASATRAQYQRFAAQVAKAQRELGFALPSMRAPWGPGHQALDAQTFGHWLDAQGLDDARLRWYLDYCCRDDYGASAAEVSAWAGLHYFASRHGFHSGAPHDTEREAVLTWPQGNAWITQRLAQPLGERLHRARTVLRVQEGRHQVQVWAWDEAAQQLERWQAPRVILALPLFIAARIVQSPPEALRQAAAQARYAPWLVANLHLNGPLLERLGVAAAWDNVVYGAQGLGYVDAMHQSTRAHPGATVLTAYWALGQAQRAALLQDRWQTWAQRVMQDLRPTHPDLAAKTREVALMRYGHAMSLPLPGVRSSPALAALRAQRGRLRFAHSDLAGYSVFEEAYTAGCLAGG